MPEYLENFGEPLYFSSIFEEEQDISQIDNQYVSPSPEPLNSSDQIFKSYPLSQALFQTIYNKGYTAGSTSSVSQQLTHWFKIHSDSIILITMLALTTGKMALSKRPSKSIKLLKSNTTKQIRSIGNTIPNLIKLSENSKSYTTKSSSSTNEIIEYDKIFEKLKKDLLISSSQNKFQPEPEHESEPEENIKTLSDKALIGFKEKGQTKFSGNTAKDIFYAMKKMKEMNLAGLNSHKIVIEYNSDGTKETKLEPKESEEDLNDSSIPSTYYKDPEVEIDAEDMAGEEELLSEIEEKGLSSIMALKKIWSKIEFQVVEWDETKGELIMNIFDPEKPDNLIHEGLKVHATFHDGIPTSIFHNGLIFEIEETQKDLIDGASIWKFSRLVEDVASKVTEVEREEEVNEPNLFDDIILSDRAKNAHIFEKSVPNTDVMSLIEAIGNEQKVEFWFDEKIGNSIAIGRTGKKENWKMRLAIYDLYEEPQWSEFTASVYFNGYPKTITLEELPEHPIPIVVCDEGQYVVRGREEDNAV
ncbi:uncharacterized protein I206_100029 [Kwoniella pini CBS 10737]|uniref:Uncharacterized protein n=1 Tax=Kwoniella pini CBS 10737 TaxID=1296096 RepID=A0A1B9HSD4_9TREE|nr:uncharacterized protein I206_07844 [Kwoniella pini CBS 10737]OCF46174.1 hypothetical protein I206_07844 [Kwoniella pini CBS 10737]